MFPRRYRFALSLGLLFMLGCDSNPSGPAAPINPAPGAGAGAPTTTPGVMPGGTVNNKKVDSPSPTAPN